MTWRLGLRASIALTVVLVTTLATAAMALVTYQLQTGPTKDQYVASATVDFLSDAGQVNEQLVSAARTGADVREFRDYMVTRRGVIWAVLRFKSTTGYIVMAGNCGAECDQLAEADVDRARGRPKPVTRIVNTRLGPQLIIIGSLGPGLILAEAYSTQQLDDQLSTLRWQLAGIAAGVALLGVLIGVVAARRIQRRVRTAAVAARKLGDGALDTRLPVQGHDELADLASSFNAMAQRLSESIEQLHVNDQRQRRFIADVAHDLRTPLASMIAAAASLDSKDSTDRTRSAELLSTQVQRLSALVEDLLEMSRFDAGVAELRPESIDLEPLAADAVALSAPEAGIQVAVTGDATIVGDPRRLHTIVSNLVTNADRHGARPITVTIDGSAVDQVRVAVADSGPGLPADLAPFVFDRFARGDRARQKTEGSGLGLAIAYENAALHGGSLEVANSRGAIFTLTVPRGDAAHSPRG